MVRSGSVVKGKIREWLGVAKPSPCATRGVAAGDNNFGIHSRIIRCSVARHFGGL